MFYKQTLKEDAQKTNQSYTISLKSHKNNFFQLSNFIQMMLKQNYNYFLLENGLFGKEKKIKKQKVVVFIFNTFQ